MVFTEGISLISILHEEQCSYGVQDQCTYSKILSKSPNLIDTPGVETNGFLLFNWIDPAKQVCALIVNLETCF